MERPVHNMANLFAQLGRPCDELAIARFMEINGPLSGGVLLHEAPFWTPAEAEFLRQAILDDADWAEVIDALNAGLHATH